MPRLVRSLCPGLVVVLVVLAGQAGLAPPAGAVGTLRYASPSGTSTQDCSSREHACNIEKAVNSASSNDEVVLEPGSYTTSTALESAASQLFVHGVAGQPRPVINSSAPIYGLFLNGFAVRVSDLAVNYTGSGVALYVFSNNVEVQRVEARVSSSGAYACSPGISGVFRDSLCVATGTGGVALNEGYTGAGGPWRWRT